MRSHWRETYCFRPFCVPFSANLMRRSLKLRHGHQNWLYLQFHHYFWSSRAKKNHPSKSMMELLWNWCVRIAYLNTDTSSLSTLSFTLSLSSFWTMFEDIEIILAKSMIYLFISKKHIFHGKVRHGMGMWCIFMQRRKNVEARNTHLLVSYVCSYCERICCKRTFIGAEKTATTVI